MPETPFHDTGPLVSTPTTPEAAAAGLLADLDYAALALAGKAPGLRLPKPDADREAGREHHADGSVSIDYRDGSSLTFPPSPLCGRGLA